MDATIWIALLIVLTSSFYLSKWLRRPKGNLPPGSLGFPFIGQTYSFLRAMKVNAGEEWLECHRDKYGPISKLSLFGKPTIFLSGQAANKFIFTETTHLALQQPESFSKIAGERNILELVGDDYRRIREALGTFLKPDILKKYVCNIDEEVRQHMAENWFGHETVKVFPLTKTLTFGVISSLIFGIKSKTTRQQMVLDMEEMAKSVWCVPWNIPFTQFHRGMKAATRVRKILMGIIEERKEALKQGLTSARGDLISYLVGVGADDASKRLTDEEILDNTVVVIGAGFDTSAVLLSFIVRRLAMDPITYDQIVKEQDEIARNKATDESLTWEDINKMKFTWRVALEQLRVIPPIFGSFRVAQKNLDFGGYLIPKGWQVFWAACSTHKDAGIFPEPSKFDPARFEKQAPPYCLVPFGGGARVCPGNEFVRVEVLVTLHYLVTNFKWKLNSKESFVVRNPVLPSPSEDLPIKLEPKTAIAK